LEKNELAQMYFCNDVVGVSEKISGKETLSHKSSLTYWESITYKVVEP